MNEFSPHDEVRDMLPAYALGDLDANQIAQVEAALATDESLREELTLIRATTAQLVGALPTHRAPAGLKAKVLDAVDAATEPRPVAAPVAPLTTARPAAARRWRRAVWPAVAGCAVAACAALAVVAVDLQGQLDDANDRIDQIGPIAQGEGMRVSTTAGLADATATMVRVGDSYVFSIHDLPEPGKGKSWQLWAAHADGTVRNLAQWSDGDRQVAVINGGDDVTEVMISHEDVTTAVPLPTSDPVADVKI